MKQDITFEPEPKQYIAYECLTGQLYISVVEVLFGGGAGGGKSLLGCFWITSSALTYPGTRWFIGRKTLQELKKSTLRTLFDVFRKVFGMKPKEDYVFNRQDNVIYLLDPATHEHQSEIYLLELDYYPSDPEYERFGSMEVSSGFVDEAGQITAKCRDVLKTRIRYRLNDFCTNCTATGLDTGPVTAYDEDGIPIEWQCKHCHEKNRGIPPKLFMSCNPTKNFLYPEFYKPWKNGTLDPDKAFIQALARDNRHNPPAYLTVLKHTKDKATLERLWFGNWEYDDDPSSLMTIDAITDLFTNTVDDGENYITYDVARKGRDRAIFFIWRGLKVIHIDVVDKSDPAFVKSPTQFGIDHANELAAKYKVPRSHIIVDEGGVGGGVVDGLPGCKGFIGSASPVQPYNAKWNKNLLVNYSNLRSQCYYTLGERVEDRLIAIDIDNSDVKQFITEELEQIKAKDADKDGKLKIIAKDEIKEHLGRSPDFADNLMMRMLPEVGDAPTPGIG